MFIVEMAIGALGVGIVLVIYYKVKQLLGFEV